MQVDSAVSTAFLWLRRLAGPFHRRRRVLDQDQNDQLPALPKPWTDDRWFRGGFPPRRHNQLQPLIDGHTYFQDLLAALRSASRRVTMSGWHLTPLMPLLRGDTGNDAILADVLNEVAARADVYVLLWCGAPALFEPTERMVEQARRLLVQRAPKVRCVLDRRARFSHDHHQKAVTVDGQVGYVGGMDLSTFQGDRWDSPDHPLRFGPNWHDVQVRLRGEIVRDVEENFCQRWNAVTGEQLEPLDAGPADPSWDTPAQIVRTIPAGFYPFAPQGEFGIHHALIAAIRRAERYVYLENQYLWSPEVIDALIDVMSRRHSYPFRVVMVLPAKAYSGKYDNDEHVRLLAKVDGGRGIFRAYSLYSGGPAIGPTGFRYLPIYVHAKVSIVDDEWFSIGSANLNGRGLATDTEMNVQSIAPEIAGALRIRLWSEHLGMSGEEVGKTDLLTLTDQAWPAAARELESCLRSGATPCASKVRTYSPGWNPGSRVLDVIQAMTLEH